MKAPTVVIVVEGGAVQNVMSDQAVNVILVDHDLDNEDYWKTIRIGGEAVGVAALPVDKPDQTFVDAVAKTLEEKVRQS
jgi:hypothetical protein